MFGLKEDDAFLDRQLRDFEYEVLGILNREEVAQVLREASLFIDASTYQAFGRTGLGGDGLPLRDCSPERRRR